MSEVIVIGGGPAGIASAVALRARGVRATVLEAGARTFAALRRVDPAMRLVSPARLSRLPGMRELDGAATYVRIGEWIERADEYRARMGVEVETGVEVTGVRAGADELVVETKAGARVARHVVDATGQLRWPRVPEVGDTGLRWKHSLDVRAADLAAARGLVIVGYGTSAAEVLATWLDVRPRGAHAWIARRSPRLITPHHVLGVDVHYWVWPLEQLPLPAGARPPRPAVFGTALATARLRASVTITGAPEAWTRDAVVLDGAPIAPDLVVLATGYRHAAPHLGALVDRHPDGAPRVHAGRSTREPRLWVVGAPGARTAASAFLRGIAADAEHVAARIAEELR